MIDSMTPEQLMALEFAAGMNGVLRLRYPDAAVAVTSAEHTFPDGTPWVRLGIQIKWLDDSIGGESCASYADLTPEKIEQTILLHAGFFHRAKHRGNWAIGRPPPEAVSP